MKVQANLRLRRAVTSVSSKLTHIKYGKRAGGSLPKLNMHLSIDDLLNIFANGLDLEQADQDPFDTLVVYLIDFVETVKFNKGQQTTTKARTIT